ncbi:hypothetical protein [Streptomyces sp. NPDC046887]|uniref:hypothetical protein n=1 Tax=Streptomyces sp. NPDC046887 TaxID=3155472 RepID=UPI0033D23B13
MQAGPHPMDPYGTIPDGSPWRSVTVLPPGPERPGRGGLPEEVPCDLVTVPARQGLEAVDILRRGGTPAVGPVLHDGACATLGFLVPPGTAARWDVPGSACTDTSGRGLRIPGLAGGCPVGPGMETVAAPEVLPGSDWLLPPGDTGPVTDPVMLRQALGEAARLIEAADNCC